WRSPARRAGAANRSHDTVVCASFSGPRWTDTTWRRWGPRVHRPASGTFHSVRCGLALRWAKKDVREQPSRLYPDTPEVDFLPPAGKGWLCAGDLGGRGPVGHTRFAASGRHAPVGH